ncbi:MAG TPA: transcriptional regulator [Acholeplasmatales bacterium]|nr:transcriptional regulator [Acholeplasmatales bacterium]
MAKDETNILFGKRIRQIRLEKGLSQEQLGYEVNLHRTYIGQIERAEKNISLKLVGQIARELEMNIQELMDFSKLK